MRPRRYNKEDYVPGFMDRPPSEQIASGREGFDESVVGLLKWLPPVIQGWFLVFIMNILYFLVFYPIYTQCGFSKHYLASVR